MRRLPDPSRGSDFLVMCLLHSGIAILVGMHIVFNPGAESMWIRFPSHVSSSFQDVFNSGAEAMWSGASFRANEALIGVLFLVIGLLLFTVAFVKDLDFHCFFAKGCMLAYGLIVLRSLWCQNKITVGPWTFLGPLFLGASWVVFLLLREEDASRQRNPYFA
ncbi:hypothetical protein KP509_25G045900 [Ceratopteris richardii]|uniref:DUF7865 domain-containing protein n=1 Tax=Ceratopteris richardii TaxID=49495 RepID=A0A8T2RPY5_CERRI|nr:hypothetical protein KP509_25G045900 [Ceratopteris richardii]